MKKKYKLLTILKKIKKIVYLILLEHLITKKKN